MSQDIFAGSTMLLVQFFLEIVCSIVWSMLEVVILKGDAFLICLLFGIAICIAVFCFSATITNAFFWSAIIMFVSLLIGTLFSAPKN